MSLLISASTNPPNECDLLQYIKELSNMEVDYIHCDIMDGKFVANKTFNHKIVGKINKLTSKPLDVHLMAQKPWKFVGKYIKNGADIVSVHYEAFDNSKLLKKTLEKIRRKGVFASLAISPNTEVSEIEPFLPYCDMVLVMSVDPGKSGQQFIQSTLDKLENLTKLVKKQGINLVIEVDGGVTSDLAQTLKTYGVNIVVVGSHLYTSHNRAKTVQSIHEA
jgi:ribulose-phosphate 3-epimerase